MAPAVPGLSAYVPVTPVLWPCITWLVSSTCSALTWACVQHRYYDNSSPGIFGKTRKMAERHTITVVGLLKDVEFHMIKGCAEVILDIKLEMLD